jgi:hypothetical protein
MEALENVGMSRDLKVEHNHASPIQTFSECIKSIKTLHTI